MPLALLGTGLVSPLGRSPREHAFFARAGVAPATPGGFVDAEGTTVRAAAHRDHPFRGIVIARFAAS